MPRTIVKYPEEVLARPCEVVTEYNDELSALVHRLTEAMYVAGGVGLAAPQLGVSRRVLVIDPSGGEVTNQLLALINPRVTWQSPEQELGPEGCLSLPGAVLRVQRAVAVDVEYHDLMGNLQTLRFTNFPARVVQHEIDHLNGVLMIDRVGRLARALVMKGLGNRR